MQLTAFWGYTFLLCWMSYKKRERRKNIVNVQNCPVPRDKLLVFWFLTLRSEINCWAGEGELSLEKSPRTLDSCLGLSIPLEKFLLSFCFFFLNVLFLFSLNLLLDNFASVFLTDMLTEFAKQGKTWCVDVIWQQLGGEFWTEWWVMSCF